MTGTVQDTLDRRCRWARRIERLGLRKLAARIRGQGLRNSLAALNETGGTVYLPPGTFDPGRTPFNVPAHTTIDGRPRPPQESPDAVQD